MVLPNVEMIRHLNHTTRNKDTPYGGFYAPHNSASDAKQYKRFGETTVGRE